MKRYRTSWPPTLYYREGSSDKVYQAAIEPAGSQFVVNFAYGRRGATLSGLWLEKAGFKPGHRVEIFMSKPGELSLQFKEQSAS